MSGMLIPACARIIVTAKLIARSHVALGGRNGVPGPCRLWDGAQSKGGGRPKSGPYGSIVVPGIKGGVRAHVAAAWAAGLIPTPRVPKPSLRADAVHRASAFRAGAGEGQSGAALVTAREGERVMSGYIDSGATISACGTYRYRLWREWRGTGTDENWLWLEDEDGSRAKDGAGFDLGEPKSVVFVMLNPSTADGESDDPTIRRCVAYAMGWGFDRMEVVNLFAYRATDPRSLRALTAADEPWGPDNCRAIKNLVTQSEVGLIVCAWGAHGGHLGQDETVLGWLAEADAPITALRLTKDGHPCHPLYLPSDLKPQRFLRAESG